MQNHGILFKTRQNMAFWQNHNIWQKLQFLWFPHFRNFLLSLIINGLQLESLSQLADIYWNRANIGHVTRQVVSHFQRGFNPTTGAAKWPFINPVRWSARAL